MGKLFSSIIITVCTLYTVIKLKVVQLHYFITKRDITKIATCRFELQEPENFTKIRDKNVLSP